jgi:hypothetical protein
MKILNELLSSAVTRIVHISDLPVGINKAIVDIRITRIRILNPNPIWRRNIRHLTTDQYKNTLITDRDVDHCSIHARSDVCRY